MISPAEGSCCQSLQGVNSYLSITLAIRQYPWLVPVRKQVLAEHFEKDTTLLRERGSGSQGLPDALRLIQINLACLI